MYANIHASKYLPSHTPTNTYTYVEIGRDLYHFGAVFDGLLGVEGAVFASDALANDARVLVNEHRGRGRLSCRIVANL